MTTLDASIAAILGGVQTALEAALATGQPLAELKEVVRGQRARPMPALPCLWVVPTAATMTRMEYDSETWSLPISVAALVKNDNAEQGAMDAQRLSAVALKIVLATRATLAASGVTDVVPESFDPAARTSERNRTLHWTEATARVTFTVDST